MNTRTLSTTVSAMLLSAALASGCGTDAPQPAADGTEPAPQSFIGRQAAKGIAVAQRKLETENIRIGSHSRTQINGRADDGLPRAEITPDGALLIAGEQVPATAHQRELLLDYRGHLLGLAQAGMAIGVQGADIAGVALTGIGQALFGGEDGRKAYEERVEAEAARIEDEAMKLCSLMPGLYGSQQALAASMPEFIPYATMTREDVDDCGSNPGGDVDVDTTIT